MTSVFLERNGQMVKFEFDSKDFSIDPSVIDQHLCNMGQLLFAYGQVEAELRLEVSRKEAALEKTTADIDTEIRMKHKALGEKATENKIRSELLLDPRYMLALDGLHKTSYNHNTMRWAMTALNKKTDCLISLSYRERQLMKLETSGNQIHG